MKMFYKRPLLVVALLLCYVQLSAQQFTTHAVTKGETLESIAKKYQVTPFNILKYNKEIKAGDPLKPNTILVVPTNGPTQKAPSKVTVQEQVIAVDKPYRPEEQQEPIGFVEHKVKKRETLYGIAQQYHIGQEDIKRYNKELYSSPLDKGMRLRIPRYPAPPKDPLESGDFEAYVVKPKETRWSIAHKFGITIDSLLALNPNLPTDSDYLAHGQQLILPKPKGSTVENQQVQLYQSYTVPPKQTFYSIEKEFGVASDELMKLNPEIKERGGLKEGMVLRIPKKKADSTAVNTDNFIFYEVKPKQTEYSLTRKFGIGFKELTDLNPDLATGVKAGMVLKLPISLASKLDVRNSLVLDKFSLLDSINPLNRPKVMVLLPFRLDKINMADAAEAEKVLGSRNDMKYALGLYSGALVAMDSIKKMGISIDVKTYDSQLSQDRVREILSRENIRELSAIFGPLSPDALKEVAVKAASAEVPVIAPLSQESDLSLENVFFSIPTDQEMREHLLAYADSIHTDQNTIVIADTKNKPVADEIVSRFPGTKTMGLKDNISMDLDKFSSLLSVDKENWVFLETDNFKVVNSVSSILNSAIADTVGVRMFTTNRNKAFENDVISNTHLSRLHFTYPSFSKETPTKGPFVKMYKARFGSEPNKYAVRGFDVMYDLLLKLAYKNNLFDVSRMIGETEYTSNKFDYAKDFLSGYFNKGVYIMEYDDMSIKEVQPETSGPPQ